MPSRRHFLQTLAAGTATLPWLPRSAFAEPPHKFKGTLGLELYTVRHLFDKACGIEEMCALVGSLLSEVAETQSQSESEAAGGGR